MLLPMGRLARFWVLIVLLTAACAGHRDEPSARAMSVAKDASFPDGLRSVVRTSSGLLRTFASEPTFVDEDGELNVVDVVDGRDVTLEQFALVEGYPAAASDSDLAAWLTRPDGAPEEGVVEVTIVDTARGEAVHEQEVPVGSTIAGVSDDEVFVNLAGDGLWRWADGSGEKVPGLPEGSKVIGVSPSYFLTVRPEGVALLDRNFKEVFLSKGDTWGSLPGNEDFMLTKSGSGQWWVYNIPADTQEEVFEDLEEIEVSWLPSGRLLAQTGLKSISCEWSGRRCFSPDPLTAGEEFGPPIER